LIKVESEAVYVLGYIEESFEFSLIPVKGCHKITFVVITIPCSIDPILELSEIRKVPGFTSFKCHSLVLNLTDISEATKILFLVK